MGMKVFLFQQKEQYKPKNIFTDEAHELEVASSGPADAIASDMYELKDKDMHLIDVDLHRTQGTQSIKQKLSMSLWRLRREELSLVATSYLIMKDQW